MRINPKQVIPQTITILNKLSAKDSATNQDVWYKHTLYGCSWNITQSASQTGTQANLGEIVQVQIPKDDNIPYKPYKAWKQAGQQDTSFTISMHDYVILGEVSESITAHNIVSIVNSYEPNVCKIRLFNDLTFDGIKADTFLEKYANIYYIEGV